MASILSNVEVKLRKTDGTPSDACDDSSMQTIYLPAMLENESWQASVTKDFKAGLDKFLASLTESIFEAEGKTVLYIPPVSLIGTMGAQTRDKDLTQRVESVVIRWTRQIKEVPPSTQKSDGYCKNTSPKSLTS